MVEYKVLLKKYVAEKIEEIEPKSELNLVRWKIAALVGNPWPSGAEPIPGHVDRYRIRVSNYRLGYRIDEIRREITIVAFGYRRLRDWRDW